jgi:glycosyltransferase involved in cell wall biosynthesis
MTSTPSVLLVTGAYHPEISAAGLQCQAAAAILKGRARVSVLATAVDPTLPIEETIDGVNVHRVPVDVRSRLSKLAATVSLLRRLARLLPGVDVVHVHGFSQKNLPVALIAKALGKPVVLTLHTSGQDEPQAASARGRLGEWAFRSAQLILPVSPNLARRCEEAGVPASKIRLTPNGLDLRRFRPASAFEKASLRRELGWPDDEQVVLFVGFFSRDKRPDLLFRAWRRVAAQGIPSKLVYVGATASPYFEIDQDIATEIRAQAAAIGRAGDVVFVPPTHAVERYYRAADIFVLASIREAHPVALLEAMACGLACIASRIEGATDVVIEDGVNGRLVDRDDEAAMAGALADLLARPGAAARLASRAPDVVAIRYDIQHTADQWMNAYEAVLT